MKNLFFILVTFFIFSGISFSATAQKKVNSARYTDGVSDNKSPKFIDGIEIKADNVVNTQQADPAPVPSKTVPVYKNTVNTSSVSIEKVSSIQFKYAQLLNRNVEEITNTSLYSFIEEWWETRYRYGGSTKSGIDCSAFTGLLMSTVFAIKLPRTAREQYSQSEKVDRDDMKEGDLVFFNTRGGVSHVGVYLGDGYFVHASTNNGVIISRLDDPYYEKRFIGAGKVSAQSNIAVTN